MKNANEKTEETLLKGVFPVRPDLSPELERLREDAAARGIPVADGETLQFLLLIAELLHPKKILEIGTAVGLSAAALLLRCPYAVLTTIECEEDRYEEAKATLAALGVGDRAICHLGDAGEILAMMDGKFDLVFLDGPKAQYEKYLFDLKRLLRPGGALFADDVLLYGWVNGKVPVPYKRRSIVEKLRGYLHAVTSDPFWTTSVLDVGDGVALSVLRGDDGADGGAKEKIKTEPLKRSRTGAEERKE